MKILSMSICPICVVVAGTWLSMLSARFLGYEVDSVLLGILIGGSVVGIAYQGVKHLRNERLDMAWKFLFIPSGFAGAYALVLSRWLEFGVMFAFLLALAAFFLKVPFGKAKAMNPTVEKLEKEMEKCC